MTSSILPWAGYESYPAHLPTLNPTLDDAADYAATLKQHSARLFSESKLNIDVLDFPSSPSPTTTGPDERNINNHDQLESILLESTSSLTKRIFVIHPANPHTTSRSKLGLTDRAARQLLATYNVMPSFIDFLTAFGEKIDTTDLLFGGGRSNDEGERCFMYKHAYLKDGRSGKSPFDWSIRSTAVYHNAGSNIYILVQPSESVVTRLRAGSTPIDPVALVVSAGERGWRPYYNALDAYFNTSTGNVLHKNLGGPALPGSRRVGPVDPTMLLDVGFTHVQILQKFEELLAGMRGCLETNADAVALLGVGRPEDVARHLRNVDRLLTKVAGRSRLLYNALEYQQRDTLNRHGDMRIQFEEHARIERVKTNLLTRKTVRDAVGVKIMTCMALLYLPASFVASFLDAGIVSFSADAGKGKVNFSRLEWSSELAVFFSCTTIVLTALTLGCWWCWDHHAGREVEDVVDEKPVKVDTWASSPMSTTGTMNSISPIMGPVPAIASWETSGNRYNARAPDAV